MEQCIKLQKNYLNGHETILMVSVFYFLKFVLFYLLPSALHNKTYMFILT